MPAIDHSALLLDADAMRAELQDRLPQLRGARECRIHQTRCRVSRKTEEQGAPYLGVVYELPAANGPTPIDRWCYVKAYSRDASRAARDAHAVHLDALDALVWTLPHDPVLTQLTDFLDAGYVQTVLRGLLGAAAGKAATPASAAIVRYEPESHCTARFELTLHGRRLAVYGKAYADEAWSAAARRARALWSAAVRVDAFAIAPPLAASLHLRALWQQEVLGTPLREALHATQASLWLARVARALAQLQAGTRLGDAVLPVDLLARTAKQCRKLVRADASLAAVLDPLLGSLQALPAIDTIATAHGDFHVDQMLCAGERVVLFDFDNFAAGSPALDVADFASQVLTDAGFDESQRIALARGFVAQCLAHLPQPPRRDELDWHLRALLLRKAYSFFVRHRDGWRERVRTAAALAARGLADLWPSETRRAA